MFVTVFRDMAHSGGKALTDWHVGNVFSIHGDGTALNRFQAGKPVDKFCLSVSVDSGDTYDLASVNLKGNAVHRIVFVALGAYYHILHIKNHFSWICFVFFYNEVYVSSYHHGSQGILIDIGYFYSLDVFTLTDNGTVIRGSCDLFQLMGNQDNALAICGQIVNDLHQTFDLLGCQGSRRLIKDQRLRSAVQNL